VRPLVGDDALEDRADERVARRRAARAGDQREAQRLAHAAGAHDRLARALEGGRAGDRQRIGLEVDEDGLGAAERHGDARVQLDVEHLVGDELAGGADQVDRRSGGEQRALDLRERRGAAVFAPRALGPRGACARDELEREVARLERAPRQVVGDAAAPEQPLRRPAHPFELERTVHRPALRAP
jgi:hypothetical protein